jgi:hypothetical protein
MENARLPPPDYPPPSRRRKSRSLVCRDGRRSRCCVRRRAFYSPRLHNRPHAACRGSGSPSCCCGDGQNQFCVRSSHQLTPGTLQGVPPSCGRSVAVRSGVCSSPCQQRWGSHSTRVRSPPSLSTNPSPGRDAAPMHLCVLPRVVNGRRTLSRHASPPTNNRSGDSHTHALPLSRTHTSLSLSDGRVGTVWSREHTLATLNADASQHPLVLAEAVGLPADIAATQRAEVAEVRSCTSALNRVLGGRT